MKENYIKFTYRLAFLLTIAVAIALPLFFLPLTSEFFEFNKSSLFLTTTLIAALAWTSRMIIQKKFTFTRTPLDIPLLLIVTITFIASISSIDQRISLYGTEVRPWPSFLSTATLAAFYFITVSNIKTRKQVELILGGLIASTAIASVISIISYFGLYVPFELSQYRSFNTMGSAVNLALLQAIVIPVCVAWILFSKNKIVRITTTVAAAISIISLVLINFVPAYFGIVVAFVLIFSQVLKANVAKSSQIAIGIFAAITALALLIRYTPLSESVIVPLILNSDENLPAQNQIDTAKNPTLPQRIGWDVATSAIGKRPLFGTGPGTFQFAYTQLKPRVMNQTPNWVVRFDRSSSEFSEMITTVGIFGTLAFLLLVITVLRFVWTLLFKTNVNIVYIASAAAAISFITSLFFVTISFSTAAVFFIVAASLVVLAKTQDEKHVHEMTVEVATLKNGFNWLPIGANQLGVLKTATTPTKGARSQVLPVLFLILILAVGFIAARAQIAAFRAEYYYRQALIAARQNNGNRTIDLLQQAIKTNPAVDTYHRVLSQTALNAALTLSNQKDLNQDQQNLLTQLVQVAIDQGKVASGYQILPLRLPGISAANAVNWEIVSAAYQSVLGSVSGADVNAINTLTQASSLDPQNPLLHDRLGILYQRVKNLDLAQRKFEDAAVIKTDFGPAYYHLAQVLIEKKSEPAKIANALTLAKRYLPANDPAIDDINSKLEDYNKQVQEQQEQAANPPAGAAQATPTPTPSPSGKPAPTATPIPTPLPSSTPSF